MEVAVAMAERGAGVTLLSTHRVITTISRRSVQTEVGRDPRVTGPTQVIQTPELTWADLS